MVTPPIMAPAIPRPVTPPKQNTPGKYYISIGVLYISIYIIIKQLYIYIYIYIIYYLTQSNNKYNAMKNVYRIVVNLYF